MQKTEELARIKRRLEDITIMLVWDGDETVRRALVREADALIKRKGQLVNRG